MTAGRSMNHRLLVLVAPDSYKGTFTSVQVADALARGWLRARPGDEIRLAPLADGGEGTLAAIEAAGGWRRERAVVRDPLGREIEAAWLRSTDGTRGVVEMAEAAGLSRVAPDERDAVAASSSGLGDLLLAALDAGVRDLVVGIGGSATTDGGRGMLEALGARVRPVEDDGRGGSTPAVVIDLTGLDPRLGELSVRVACDVTNPLLGERGAAAVYGPQKGATPELVPVLERRLAAWADGVEAALDTPSADLPRALRDVPGAGAAGGVGFGLLALETRFRRFALQPGVELVMAATGFGDRLAAADLVLTGEGRIDAQTAFGKTAAGVARLAQRAGIRCIAVGGSVQEEGRAALAAFGAEAIPVGDGRGTLSDAIAAGTAPIEAAGERLAASLGVR